MISEDFLKFPEHCPKLIQTFPIIFRKFPQMFEDYQRLLNSSSGAIFEDVSIIQK